MFLDNRKKRILQAIINDYVETAEPVGSRTIARKHQLGLSSATIRNEMADLEEMGYLAQPYTSAGRVPSDKGYRFYVDQLMKVRQLTDEESENLKKAMEERINELGQLIKLASSVMSRFTKYTSMAITPKIKRSTLRAVQVVPIEEGKALVIVVTSAGIVKNSMAKIPDIDVQNSLERVSNVLNEKLRGLTVEEISLSITGEIVKEAVVSSDLIRPVLKGVIDCINQIDSSEIYLEGATNIFNFPEFSDLNKAKEFLDVLDSKDVVLKLLSYSDNISGINIQIGNENEIERIKDCSLITATYSLGNVMIGSIGIIGPTRMEYEKVISSMNFIRRNISEETKKLLGESE